MTFHNIFTTLQHLNFLSHIWVCVSGHLIGVGRALKDSLVHVALILTPIEPHLSATNVKDGHDALQKDVSEHVRTVTATGYTYLAIARGRVDNVAVDEIIWVNVQLLASNDDGKHWRY